MIRAHIEKRSAVPWWAAFGAPLLGVPLLVGLLALGSVGGAKAGAAGDVGTGTVTEQSEALQASAEMPPVVVEADAHPRC